MSFEGEYEYAKSTQRMVMLVHRTKNIRRSDLPYVYMSKLLYADLGGIIPKDGERSDQTFRLRIEKNEDHTQ